MLRNCEAARNEIDAYSHSRAAEPNAMKTIRLASQQPSVLASTMAFFLVVDHVQQVSVDHRPALQPQTRVLFRRARDLLVDVRLLQLLQWTPHVWLY